MEETNRIKAIAEIKNPVDIIDACIFLISGLTTGNQKNISEEERKDLAYLLSRQKKSPALRAYWYIAQDSGLNSDLEKLAWQELADCRLSNRDLALLYLLKNNCVTSQKAEEEFSQDSDHRILFIIAKLVETVDPFRAVSMMIDIMSKIDDSDYKFFETLENHVSQQGTRYHLGKLKYLIESDVMMAKRFSSTYLRLRARLKGKSLNGE